MFTNSAMEIDHLQFSLINYTKTQLVNHKMFSKITAIKPPKFGFALANESKLLISRRGSF